MAAPCRRCVIVGNGPSLRDHLALGDFDLLRQVDTIGMNLIDWLYEPDPDAGLPGTAWRPTWWIMVEHLGYNLPPQVLWRQVLERHILPGVETCLIDRRFRPAIIKETDAIGVGSRCLDRVRWMARADCDHGVQPPSRKVPTAWHLPEFCSFSGTITTALQFAFMLGYVDVALIGCDLGIKADGDHFHPRYRSHSDGHLILVDDALRLTHALAARHFQDHGRSIVNAGIGGLLDLYPRQPLVDWLAKEATHDQAQGNASTD